MAPERNEDLPERQEGPVLDELFNSGGYDPATGIYWDGTDSNAAGISYEGGDEPPIEPGAEEPAANWVPVDNEDCGTGAGGFKPGNTCAAGAGGGRKKVSTGGPAEQGTTDAGAGTGRPVDVPDVEPLPKALPWRDPPPKLGKTGEGMKARPKGDESQTKIGDLGESMALQIGFRSLLPPGQRSHKPGEVEEKGSTIDLAYDHTKRAYELKLCNTTATEYRLKAKKSEKEAKERYATMNGLTAHVLVGVRDVATGEIHFYASKQPGLTGAEVSPKAFDYVGTVSLSGKEPAPAANAALLGADDPEEWTPVDSVDPGAGAAR